MSLAHSRKRLLIVMVAATVIAGTALWFRSWRNRVDIPQTRIAERSLADPAAASRPAAEDWPRWLGPRGDGISRERGLAVAWPAGGPRQVWSAEVGLGYASPIAVAGRVYLFTYNGGREALTAFDAHSGRIVWNSEVEGGWSGSHPGTRATPLVDGDRIYTFGGAGDLICRTLSGGTMIWQTNVLTATRSRNLHWGVASPPLLSDGLLFVQGGRNGPTCVAIRTADGSIAWQSEARTTSGYAHPIVASVDGSPQLIVFAGDAVYGMEPWSGRTLWSEPWPTKEQVNSAPPVYAKAHLFVTSAEGQGSMILRLSARGATRLWTSQNVQGYFQAPLQENDVIYLNNDGALTCLQFPSGEVTWTAKDPGLRPGFGGSLVRVDGDLMLILTARGKLILARVSSAGAEQLAAAQVLQGAEIYATPLVYGGRLYIKGMQELVCLDLCDPDGRSQSPETLPSATPAATRSAGQTHDLPSAGER